MKKYIKENIKENIIIFFLLFSLKNNEENKRKKEGKSWGKFYQGSWFRLHRVSCLPLTSSSPITLASHLRRPFQRPPLSLRLLSSTSKNLPFSRTRVPMDEVHSSNQVPMSLLPYLTQHENYSSLYPFSLYIIWGKERRQTFQIQYSSNQHIRSKKERRKEA